jgi:uncharacterized protein YecE (DUF72 family)
MLKKILVGTSGYNYPHWRNVFYPRGVPSSKWLEFYAQHFPSVELNVTFYRLPTKDTFRNWYKTTPGAFRFIIKGSRFITHIKRLRACQKPLRLFLDHAQELKNKLVCILWQLPPSFKYDQRRLHNFIVLLSRHAPGYAHSFEFRHQSWFNQSAYQRLRQSNYGLCIADSPSFPTHKVLTADFLYLRFHGGKTLYGSEYSQEELNAWVDTVREWSKRINLLLAFFNNDAHGFAPKNARQFNTLLYETL